MLNKEERTNQVVKNNTSVIPKSLISTCFSKGISIGEMVLVTFIISILAIILVPRFFNVTREAKWQVCRTNAANINALVQLYYIKEGTWPVNALSEIETNTNYFPEATLPQCPVTTSATYSLVTATHRVTGHLYGATSHP